MNPFSPPQSSKKRGSQRSDSAFMDSEVVETPPPLSFRRKFRSKEKKPINIHEVVDIDEVDDSMDAMIIDVEQDMEDSGSTLENNFGSGYGKHAKDNLGAMSKAGSLKNSGLSSHNLVHDAIDLSHYENYYDFAEIMNSEDMDMVQALFDSLDLPTGVEATIPWFSDHSSSKTKTCEGSSASGYHGEGPSGSSKPSVSSSSLQKPVDASKYHPVQSLGQSSSSAHYSPQGGLREYQWQQYSLGSRLSKTAELNQSDASAPSVGVNGKPSRWGPPPVPFVGANDKPSCWGPPVNAINGGAGTFASNLNHQLLNQAPGTLSGSPYFHHSGSSSYRPNLQPPQFKAGVPPVNAMSGAGSSSYPYNFIGPKFGFAPSPWTGPTKLLSNISTKKSNPVLANHIPLGGVDVSPQEIMDMRKNLKAVNEEDILNMFKLFKKFETVEEFSDHHYSKMAVKQPSKSWVKKIQDEWRILENDLPDTIFVRVCETRMDIMRAVIIGAEGTPYHDGLFVFDVFFPATYPKVPPKVYYHSGGLRLNPNLYDCGKVCLSLLNTWSGGENEKWLPEMSTMLQVLVSIQALILNQKPYFNEPGYARSSGTPYGESMSLHYNENTFISSLRTMMYTIKKPPQHFQDFVVGHFFLRAHDILVACRAYVGGAQVGCPVKGVVQDVVEGDNSSSGNFRDQLAQCANLLVKELTVLGVKDCEKFLINTKTVKAQTAVANIPKSKSKPDNKILAAFS